MSDRGPTPINDITRLQDAVRPEAEAIWFEGKGTSFGALHADAIACARTFLLKGSKPGDRVACLTMNNAEFFAFFLGAAMARLCVVPINFRLAPPELVHILSDSGANLIFCDDELAGLANQSLSQCDATPAMIRFGTGEGLRFAEWIEAGRASDAALPTALSDDAVIQLYTSGTTGTPKGVPLTHANYAAFFETAIPAWAEFEPGKTNLVAMPLFHVAGINTALAALLQGARILVLAELVPGELLELLDSQKVAYAFLVPAVLNILLSDPGIDRADLDSLERIYYGASPITEDLLRRTTARFKAGFVQLYGMTETSGVGTYLVPSDHDAAKGKLTSCGRAMPGVEVRIVDADGAPLAAGEIGQVQIRSLSNTRGYWRRPDASAELLEKDGWLNTGDMALADDDGYLYIKDRLKDMIISGGENIYPAEVENALAAHPDVLDAAVVGVPDAKWGETVKAILVLREGVSLDEAALLEHCRARIARYKCPRIFEARVALPRNASGKILRRELRDAA